MNDFINVNKKDPKVQVKINDLLDRYKRLPPKYQWKIGYDSLFQNIIRKGLINVKGTTRTELDIKIKMKFSRIKYLENKKLIYLNVFTPYKWKSVISN